jgi:hypothetical protein
MSGSIIGGCPVGYQSPTSPPAGGGGGTGGGGTTPPPLIPPDPAAPTPSVPGIDYLLGDTAGPNRLYDDVQAILPGVLYPVLQMELWNVVEEFAIRSTYFRDHVHWQMPAGVCSYDFNPYDGAMSVCWVLMQHGLYRWRVIPPAELVDLEEPKQARHGWALLALKPSRFSRCLPSILFSNWFEVMLDGVLFRLYGSPAKPYSDPQRAQYHGRRFRAGIQLARDVAQRNYTGDQQPRWAFPYFARGRRR